MRRALGLVALVGCAERSEPDAAVEVASASGSTTVALISFLSFEPIVDGTSRGFDLDGAVSTPGAASGCGRADLVAPDGTPGIDNAFGGLLPVITSLGGEALQSLLQAAVLSGELLLLVEIDDLDGTPTGACTDGRIVRGAINPFLGTDGAILPGQTFDTNPDYPSAELGCVSPQADGSILADGLSLRLPLHVFDETIDVTLVNGRILLAPDDRGWSGVIAGGVTVAELSSTVLGFDAIPEELEQGVVAAVELMADLEPDEAGDCQQLSVTLACEAVSAFLYPVP